MHEGVATGMDNGNGYIEIRTMCIHLQRDNRCGIYEQRPHICREQGSPQEGVCDFFTQDLKQDLYFDTDEDLETWLASARHYQAERKERRKARHRKRLRALH